MKDNNPFIPVATYDNADVLKHKIYLDNKGKSGIYLWTNLINGKQYIGSAVDLRKRMFQYYSLKSLRRFSSMAINRALLKYGHSNFSLEIQEYCKMGDLLERENSYFKLFLPEYNISQEPGSSMLGRTHSEETKQRISASILGKILGIPKSEEHKQQLSLSQPNAQKIEVTDLETDTKLYIIPWLKLLEV